MASPTLEDIKKVPENEGTKAHVGRVRDQGIEGRNGEEESVRRNNRSQSKSNNKAKGDGFTQGLYEVEFDK